MEQPKNELLTNISRLPIDIQKIICSFIFSIKKCKEEFPILINGNNDSEYFKPGSNWCNPNYLKDNVTIDKKFLYKSHDTLSSLKIYFDSNVSSVISSRSRPYSIHIDGPNKNKCIVIVTTFNLPATVEFLDPKEKNEESQSESVSVKEWVKKKVLRRSASHNTVYSYSKFIMKNVSYFSALALHTNNYVALAGKNGQLWLFDEKHSLKHEYNLNLHLTKIAFITESILLALTDNNKLKAIVLDDKAKHHILKPNFLPNKKVKDFAIDYPNCQYFFVLGEKGELWGIPFGYGTLFKNTNFNIGSLPENTEKIWLRNSTLHAMTVNTDSQFDLLNDSLLKAYKYGKFLSYDLQGTFKYQKKISK